MSGGHPGIDGATHTSAEDAGAERRERSSEDSRHCECGYSGDWGAVVLERD